METLSAAWEWAKADWRHDWETGYTELCFFLGFIAPALISALRSSFRRNVMKGYRGED